MSQTNYVPTPLHRRRGPKSRLASPKKIAVWFVGAKKNQTHNWFQDQLLQVQPSNERQRLDLNVVFSDTPDELPRGLIDRQMDGVIIQGMEPSASCMQSLADLPHVWFMTRRTVTYPGDYVEPDNDMNGRLAADYLHSRGHKVVASLSTDAGYSAVSWRVRAFHERARELGMEVQESLGRSKNDLSYLETNPFSDEIETIVKRLLQNTRRPTGLYIPVDHVCGSLFRALRQSGLKSETDFEAVLGNYNPVIYHNLDHLPAALDINLPTLVRKVVDLLIWRIDNPKAPGRIGINISPTLIQVAQSRRLSA